MKLIDQATTALIEQDVKAHFPEGAVREVAIVRHGDDPAVGPGEAGVQMTIASPAGMEPDGQFLDFFKSTYREAFARLRQDVAQRFPVITQIEIISGTDPRNRFITRLHPGPGGTGLTPVTVRLGAADLETLDTLITAGIVPSREDGIRFALARIRERPAYPRLRERAPEIEELRSQL